MDNDRGFYRWLKEPGVSADGRRSLSISDGGPFRPLTDKALAEIVSSVNAWYDAAGRADVA